MTKRNPSGLDAITILSEDATTSKAVNTVGLSVIPIRPARTGGQRVRPPTKKQKQIADLYATCPMTQDDCAELVSKRLGEPITQSTVSRAVKAMNRWRKSENLPIIPTRKTGRRPESVAPEVIVTAPRKDGRTERQRAKRTDDD